MTCRDLSNAKLGKCYYSPLIDGNGNLVNDPLIFKLDEKKWRLCIADSDVLFFAKGLASGKNFNVNIYEANVDTIAVQGPKSQSLMQKVFGDEIKELKFFNYKYYNFKGVKHLISKTGYSKQGGYEIHIENTVSGLELYDHFFKIGKDFNLKPNLSPYFFAVLLWYPAYENLFSILRRLKRKQTISKPDNLHLHILFKNYILVLDFCLTCKDTIGIHLLQQNMVQYQLIIYYLLLQELFMSVLHQI